MDREIWRATVPKVAKNWTRLKQFSTHAILTKSLTLFLICSKYSESAIAKTNTRFVCFLHSVCFTNSVKICLI